MKKALVLAAAAALFATPAFALTIVGSAHDLSSSNGGTSTEVCVYCHTPHSANMAVSKAPLWNRTVVNATAVYDSATLNATGGAIALADVNQTDAPLCLTCHDGSVAETLYNEPNYGTTDLSGYTFVSTSANLGDDLSNDHPVGFLYDATLFAADPGLNDPAGAAVSALLFSESVWCSSCHDVHDNAFAPFLRIDNAGSALCLTCHNK